MQNKKFLNHPTQPFIVSEKKSIRTILNEMSKISFQGRNLALAFQIYQKMLREKTFIFLGLSGAMVPAGMRRIISYLIKNRYLDCIVSTGANIFHDIHEALGRYHYLGSSNCDDRELYRCRIDRIYDTFASEEEFIKTDNFISKFAEKLPDRLYTTREFFYLLGKYIKKYQQTKGIKITDSIIVSAAKANVPIYCPALADSSIGIALAELFYHKKKKIKFDIIKDIEETAYLAARFASSSVIYIGGGVPKNFIQQTEVTAPFLGYQVKGHKYAIQITQDSPHWGGLSGCTFTESQSWGKIALDAKTVTLYAEATVVLPILVSGLAQVKIKRKYIPHLIINQDTIKSR